MHVRIAAVEGSMEERRLQMDLSAKCYLVNPLQKLGISKLAVGLLEFPESVQHGIGQKEGMHIG